MAASRALSGKGDLPTFFCCACVPTARTARLTMTRATVQSLLMDGAPVDEWRSAATVGGPIRAGNRHAPHNRQTLSRRQTRSRFFPLQACGGRAGLQVGGASFLYFM